MSGVTVGVNQVINGVTTQVAIATTNASGAYTTGALLPGVTPYFLRINSLGSNAGYQIRLYNNLPCPNGVCTVSSGTPVVVSAGTTTSNIDFALTQGGRITGTVKDLNGNPLQGITIQLFSSTGAQVSASAAVTDAARVCSRLDSWVPVTTSCGPSA